MTTLRCPTCLRPYGPANRRTCARCSEPILRKHRWRIGNDGRLEHRNCADPELTATVVVPTDGTLRLEAAS